MSAVLERLLRYVQYDTQSDDTSPTYPSTAKQRVLLEALRDELQQMGLTDVSMDEYGYVMATVPATSSHAVPTIGFIAHVDTSPEMSGTNVKPLVHRAYDGRDLVFPDAPDVVLRASEWPALAARVGDDIVTASGTTLLGADNKAGVAEIMTAVEHLARHPEILHGPIRIAFTPDEEVGRGTEHFDVSRFGAAYAYTMDGGARGHLECESFSADTVAITFHGFNTHPGYAKGRMVNAIKAAADFITHLPADTLSPETTSGYEGFVHPNAIEASVDITTVRLLIRDFTEAGLRAKHALLRTLAEETTARFGGMRVEITVTEQYRNMRSVIDAHPHVVAYAREAIVRAGLTVHERPIRGGTDGSRLSFMGVPTPNIFAGEQNFHSRLEWVSVQDMEKAVDVILHLVQIWHERT